MGGTGSDPGIPANQTHIAMPAKHIIRAERKKPKTKAWQHRGHVLHPRD
jgi:hypothetical protein